MTLQDGIAAELPFLRAQAESRMLSRATVHRHGASEAQDEDTGLEGSDWSAVITGSPFRLGGSERGSSGSRTVNIGGAELTLALRTGHFPADTDNLADGDLIEVTSGENAGSVWRVVEGDWADQQTARRVPIVATERPEEWA